MSVNERLWDDSIFVPAGMPRPAPNAVGQLLVNLHVSTELASRKAAAIGRWLEGHKPSPKLERSLRRAGYGSLLSL